MPPNLIVQMTAILTIIPATIDAMDSLPIRDTGGGALSIYLDIDLFGVEDRDYS